MFKKVKSVVKSAVQVVKRQATKLAVACGLGASAVLSAPPAQAAITVDYSGITAGLETQFGAALTAAMPILGIIMGVYLGVKAYKRFAK